MPLDDRLRVDLRLHDAVSGGMVAADGVVIDRLEQMFEEIDPVSARLTTVLESLRH